MSHGQNRNKSEMISEAFGDSEALDIEKKIEEIKSQLRELEEKILNPGEDDDVDLLMIEKENLKEKLQVFIGQLRQQLTKKTPYLNTIQSSK